MTSQLKLIAKTDILLAEKFYNFRFGALHEALSDTQAVLDFVSKTYDRKKGFRESWICKGCVLPVVDTVATKFLTDECGVARRQIGDYLVDKCWTRWSMAAIGAKFMTDTRL